MIPEALPLQSLIRSDEPAAGGLVLGPAASPRHGPITKIPPPHRLGGVHGRDALLFSASHTSSVRNRTAPSSSPPQTWRRGLGFRHRLSGIMWVRPYLLVFARGRIGSARSQNQSDAASHAAEDLGVVIAGVHDLV